MFPIHVPFFVIWVIVCWNWQSWKLIYITVSLALSRALPIDRDDWHQNGDEELNDALEESVATAAVTSIPSTLKAVIKFGYETGLKNALGSEDFDAWIAGVFTHTRAHFRHAASLGTTIEFEVYSAW